MRQNFVKRRDCRVLWLSRFDFGRVRRGLALEMLVKPVDGLAERRVEMQAVVVYRRLFICAAGKAAAVVAEPLGGASNHTAWRGQ